MTKKVLFVVSSGKLPDDAFDKWLYLAYVPEGVDVFEATGMSYWDVPAEVVGGPCALRESSISEAVETLIRHIYDGTSCLGCYTLIGFTEEAAEAINAQVVERLEVLKAQDAEKEQARLVREWRKRQLLAA